MGTLNRAMTKIRQTFSGSNLSKRERDTDAVDSQSSKQPRLAEEGRSPQPAASKDIAGSGKFDTMEIDSSDGEVYFMKVREQMQVESDLTDETYQSNFFEEALEAITSLNDEDSDQQLGKTESRRYFSPENKERDVTTRPNVSHIHSSPADSESSDTSEDPNLLASSLGKNADSDRKNDSDDETSDARVESRDENPDLANLKSSTTQPSTQAPEADTDSASSVSDSPDTSEYPDLFASTFGKDADRKSESDDDNEPSITEIEIEDENPQSARPESPPVQPSAQVPETSTPSLFLQTLKDQGYDFLPCEHTGGCRGCDPIQRLRTPPTLPSPFLPTTHPRLPTAISRDLTAHHRWHARAKQFVPTLSLRDTFDASRRYWIAVLLQGRGPAKAASGRDYVWMKGNRFSTVATVWHHFQTTTMADPDDLVLLVGRARPAMTEQVRELDFFGDRLVLFRAVGRNHPDAMGRDLVAGLEPEVIELD